eukprot:CAMPEP_0182943280 /NCGR_PEP_ID=MMETSP0105_2-20130417/52140_1 /TAXON_ID=81532 ORGANISM="Acanthoeca-like sp., Strain 10tr" /NCGR_SAMPLE_ID=MMETSP0105_2 /ASSEMBLY_ACC=CAM_ASM_000205 /LENGTH=79 /DNA_ID=CAMNT_0025083107 /DNA_START=125 /DNA_END=362 /DNA_ORIENTATION=+
MTVRARVGGVITPDNGRRVDVCRRHVRDLFCVHLANLMRRIAHAIGDGKATYTVAIGVKHYPPRRAVKSSRSEHIKETA